MDIILFVCLLTPGVVLSNPLKMSETNLNMNITDILYYSDEGSNNTTRISIDKDFNVTSTAENNSIHMLRRTDNRKDDELSK